MKSSCLEERHAEVGMNGDAGPAEEQAQDKHHSISQQGSEWRMWLQMKACTNLLLGA